MDCSCSYTEFFSETKFQFSGANLHVNENASIMYPIVSACCLIVNSLSIFVQLKITIAIMNGHVLLTHKWIHEMKISLVC